MNEIDSFGSRRSRDAIIFAKLKISFLQKFPFFFWKSGNVRKGEKKEFRPSTSQSVNGMGVTATTVTKLKAELASESDIFVNK